jgi:hypothetical protein
LYLASWSCLKGLDELPGHYWLRNLYIDSTVVMANDRCSLKDSNQ